MLSHLKAIALSPIRLAQAIWLEPGLLVLLVLLPFVIVALFITNGRVSEQAQAIHELRFDIAQQRAEASGLLMTAAQTVTDRIENLEYAIYVEVRNEIDKKRRPVTPAETWQRQRDEELRKRLAALEKWRLAQGRE